MGITLSYTTRDNKVVSGELPYDIERLGLRYKHIKHIDLSPLVSLPMIREIDLSFNQIEDIDLSPLASLPELEFLSLESNDLLEIDLAPLSNCPKLKTLRLPRCGSISHLDLSPLSSCAELDYLIFDGLKNLKTVNISPLVSCNMLRVLIFGNNLESLNLAPLANHTYLQRLSLYELKTNQIELAPLSSCEKLDELGIWIETPIELDLAPLSKCKNLRKLSFSGKGIRALDITPLFSCNNLEKLGFSYNTEISLMACKECKTIPHPPALEEVRDRIGYGGEFVDLVYEEGGRHWNKETKRKTVTIPVDIEELKFAKKQVKVFDFSQLKQLTCLTQIYFQDNYLEEIDLSFCTHLKNLKHLNISGNNIKELNMTPLKRCTSLEELELTTSASVIDFKKLPTSLVKLVVNGRENKLKPVPANHLPNLKIINLNGVIIGDTDIQNLSFSTKLEQVSIMDCKSETLDLSFCSNLSNLKSLILRNWMVSIDLSPLKKCRNLEEIDLYQNQLENVDLSPLKSLTQLKKLNLSSNRLNHIDLTALSKLIQLEVINLQSNHLSHIDLEPLRELTNLDILNLERNHFLSIDITPILQHHTKNYNLGVEKVLIESSCVSNKEEYIQGFKSNRSLRPIYYDKTEKIFPIEIPSENRYSNDVLMIHLPESIRVVRLPFTTEHTIDLNQLKNFPMLEVLILGSAGKTRHHRGKKPKKTKPQRSQFSIEHDLTPLRECSSLKELRIGYMLLGSLDLTPLENLSNLEILHAYGNYLTSIDLGPLRKCKKLREISLRDNLLSSIDLSALGKCKNLRAINLNDNLITDIDLSPLKNCTRLETLNLLENPLTLINIDPLLSLLKLEKLYYKHIAVISDSDFFKHWNEPRSHLGFKWMDSEADLRYESWLVRLPVKMVDGTRNELSVPSSVVNLPSHNITEIDLSSLRRQNNTTHLILDSNSVEQIDLAPLQHCHNLVHLSISNNKLKSIDLSPLVNCRDLQIIDFSRNDLESIDLSPLSQLKRIQEVHLNHNNLKEIELYHLLGSASKVYEQPKLVEIQNNSMDEVDVTSMMAYGINCKVNIGKAKAISLFRGNMKFWPYSLRRAHRNLGPISFKETINKRGWSGFMNLLVNSQLFEIKKGKFVWQNYASLLEVLQGFDLSHFFGVDTTVNELLRDIPANASFSVARRKIEQKLVKQLKKQINEGGPTIFLDTIELSKSKAAKLVPVIESLRKREIDELTIPVKNGYGQLRYLRVTHYGYTILRKLNIRYSKVKEEKLVEIQKELKKIGFKLETTEGSSARYSVNMSKEMKSFISKLDKNPEYVTYNFHKPV